MSKDTNQLDQSQLNFENKIRRLEIEGFKNEFYLASQIQHLQSIINDKERELCAAHSQITYLKNLIPVIITRPFYTFFRFLRKFLVYLLMLPFVIAHYGGITTVVKSSIESVKTDGIVNAIKLSKRRIMERRYKFDPKKDTLSLIKPKNAISLIKAIFK